MPNNKFHCLHFFLLWQNFNINLSLGCRGIFKTFALAHLLPLTLSKNRMMNMFEDPIREVNLNKREAVSTYSRNTFDIPVTIISIFNSLGWVFDQIFFMKIYGWIPLRVSWMLRSDKKSLKVHQSVSGRMRALPAPHVLLHISQVKYKSIAPF